MMMIFLKNLIPPAPKWSKLRMIKEIYMFNCNNLFIKNNFNANFMHVTWINK